MIQLGEHATIRVFNYKTIYMYASIMVWPDLTLITWLDLSWLDWTFLNCPTLTQPVPAGHVLTWPVLTWPFPTWPFLTLPDLSWSVLTWPVCKLKLEVGLQTIQTPAIYPLETISILPRHHLYTLQTLFRHPQDKHQTPSTYPWGLLIP